MHKKIIYSLRNFYLKAKYRKKINFKNGKFSKNRFSSIKNINIVTGKIVINGRLHMKHNSLIATNNNGILEIGNACFINCNTIIASLGKITIGNNVSIGPNVCIYDHDHDYNEKGQILGKYKIGKITIGNNVWIGAGAVILKNTIIGDNCVIGAGTIVKGEIPANSLIINDREIIVKKLKS